MHHLRIATLLLFGIVALGGVKTAWADVVYSFTTFDPPGSARTTLNGINDSGQIVGYYNNPGPGNANGFLYSNGSFTTIDVPGANYTDAWGISNSGQIVGQFGDATGFHGFLYSNGSFTTIDFPGVGGSAAVGINDSGQIVGFNNATGSFLYTAGSFTPINVPGATQGNGALGINDGGQIVGYYRNSNNSHGFLATPTFVPEPRTLPLLAR
jgi:probable HAF family extracellular repeat protein